ncbi:MAG: PLP-dependent aminotransferase family protein [Anaerolineae bacterium]|nr:PLP-dependent aminotransferase family protein [Anaerolineae bacterium]
MTISSPSPFSDPVKGPDKPRVYAYERLALDIYDQIKSGALRPGDRLLSVRFISCQKKVSPATVHMAYQSLEDKGLIEVRPQSGHYVRLQTSNEPVAFEDKNPLAPMEPRNVQLKDLFSQIREDATRADLVQFGAALPAPDLLPGARINNILARLARSGKVPLHLLGSARGDAGLRAQISRRAFLAGCNLNPDELLITNGCTEAVHLALRAVCRPGDLVAVESPAYYGILQVIDSLGLKIVEIPSHPREGISLDVLQSSLKRFPIRAVMVVPNFNNPLGCCMPDENKRALAELAARQQIALIEDDIYGDLSFSDRRPLSIRSFDQQGWVMLCSSYSKTLSPGFRVGWIAAGRWQNEVEKLKAATNLFCPILPQQAIARFLESGGYDHVLRRMRRRYALNIDKMAAAVLRFFPTGTRITTPEGGFVLWVQMPAGIDSLELYRRALALGVTLAPGYLFASHRQFASYIRLSAATLNNENAWVIKRLGELAHELAG